MARGETYEEFVAKFEHKKTTDDCYTPQGVYDTVCDWVEKEYGVDRKNFVRPFWPGGDYLNYNYKVTDIVVDNPPFSILSEICSFYNAYNIPFFLFAPALVMFNSTASKKQTNLVCVGAEIVFENGAHINISFVTSFGNEYVRSAPDLYKALQKFKPKGKTLPKYKFPINVATSAMIGQLSKYGVDFSLNYKSCHFIRRLDNQGKKTVFGGGLLISDKMAKELTQALAKAEMAKAKIEWTLSENEKKIIEYLNKQEKQGGENYGIDTKPAVVQLAGSERIDKTGQRQNQSSVPALDSGPIQPSLF